MVGDIALGMRRGRLLLAGALLVSACSGTTSETSTTLIPTTTTTTTTTSTTPPTTITTSTTTTVAPTTTTVDPLARPDVLVSNVNRDSIDDFDTSGDNPYEMMMELKDLFVFLEGNPTGTAMEMVARVFEPSYPVWDPIIVGFRELTDNPGWRYVDPGVETLAIELVDATETRAVLRVADQRGDQVIADAEGKTVRTYEGWDRKASTITIRRGADGQWRYADLEPSVPISDEELATMVPVEWTGRTP